MRLLKNISIPSGDWHVYIIKCESKKDPLNEESIKYKIKNSGINSNSTKYKKELEELPIDKLTPSKWSQIDVYYRGEYHCPLYIELARHANQIFYIGKTKNLEKRIKKHCEGYGSKFTKQMELIELVRIESINQIDNSSPVPNESLSEFMKDREEYLSSKLTNTPTKNNKKDVDLSRLHSFAYCDISSPN